MKRIHDLAMTDVASRPRGGRVWWIGLGSLLLVVLYALIRNYVYISKGMLGPNFGLIHQAYNFNLGELPWVLGGFGILSLGLSITWKGYRKWLVLFAGMYFFLCLDLVALRFYVTHYEPEQLVVQRVTIETPKLSAPLRILHMSDIQSGGISEYEIAMFKRVAELEPDLIINTGDFLQVVPPATFDSELPKLLDLIRQVNPRYGTYGVFGDTELEMYRVKPEVLEPLVFLSAHTKTIETGAGVLSLHGLNLHASRSGDWALRSVMPWLADSAAGEFRILFGHAPDFSLKMEDLAIDLCMAGHTHGGQVQVPWYGPLVIDSEIPREWASGFRRIGLPYLNVSAGAGSNRYNGLPPIRFNCPTEMTLIELVPMRTIR